MVAAQYFCYVEPNRLTLISSIGSSYAIPLAANLISDLEVINRETLVEYVVQFLQANSVLAGEVTFLLAPINLFEQDLSAVSPKDVDVLSQKFIDSVPFETVISKRMVITGKLRLICANQDFLDSLKKAFQKMGFIVEGFIPYTVIQIIVPELATSINPPIVFAKLDALQQYSVTVEIIKPTAFEKKTGLKGRRDMILLGVFGLLILVLLYLVLATYVFAPKTRPQLPPTRQTTPLIFPTVPVGTQSSQQISPTLSIPSSNSHISTP